MRAWAGKPRGRCGQVGLLAVGKGNGARMRGLYARGRKMDTDALQITNADRVSRLRGLVVPPDSRGGHRPSAHRGLEHARFLRSVGVFVTTRAPTPGLSALDNPRDQRDGKKHRAGENDRGAGGRLNIV